MRLILAAGVALVLVASAATPHAQSGPVPSPAVAALMAAHDAMMKAMDGPTAVFSGDPDLDFVTQMIPHHQGAIDMAKAELAYGTSANVRDLAKSIISAQAGEIALMSKWKESHVLAPTTDAVAIRAGYEASNKTMMDGMSGGHDHMGSTADQPFLTMMVPHHQGAIDMAAVQLKYGKDPQVLALAARIIAAQKAEIVDMKLLAMGDGHGDH